MVKSQMVDPIALTWIPYHTPDMKIYEINNAFYGVFHIRVKGLPHSIHHFLVDLGPWVRDGTGWSSSASATGRTGGAGAGDGNQGRWWNTPSFICQTWNANDPIPQTLNTKHPLNGPIMWKFLTTPWFLGGAKYLLLGGRDYMGMKSGCYGR